MRYIVERQTISLDVNYKLSPERHGIGGFYCHGSYNCTCSSIHITEVIVVITANVGVVVVQVSLAHRVVAVIVSHVNCSSWQNQQYKECHSLLHNMFINLQNFYKTAIKFN